MPTIEEVKDYIAAAESKAAYWKNVLRCKLEEEKRLNTNPNTLSKYEKSQYFSYPSVNKLLINEMIKLVDTNKLIEVLKAHNIASFTYEYEMRHGEKDVKEIAPLDFTSWYNNLLINYRTTKREDAEKFANSLMEVFNEGLKKDEFLSKFFKCTFPSSVSWIGIHNDIFYYGGSNYGNKQATYHIIELCLTKVKAMKESDWITIVERFGKEEDKMTKLADAHFKEAKAICEEVNKNLG